MPVELPLFQKAPPPRGHLGKGHRVSRGRRWTGDREEAPLALPSSLSANQTQCSPRPSRPHLAWLWATSCLGTCTAGPPLLTFRGRCGVRVHSVLTVASCTSSRLRVPVNGRNEGGSVSTDAQGPREVTVLPVVPSAGSATLTPRRQGAAREAAIAW